MSIEIKNYSQFSQCVLCPFQPIFIITTIFDTTFECYCNNYEWKLKRISKSFHRIHEMWLSVGSMHFPTFNMFLIILKKKSKYLENIICTMWKIENLILTFDAQFQLIRNRFALSIDRAARIISSQMPRDALQY